MQKWYKPDKIVVAHFQGGPNPHPPKGLFHNSGQIIATSHDLGPPKVAKELEGRILIQHKDD